MRHIGTQLNTLRERQDSPTRNRSSAEFLWHLHYLHCCLSPSTSFQYVPNLLEMHCGEKVTLGLSQKGYWT